MRALEEKLPTNTQAELLDAIDLFESEHKRPPRIRELAGMLGVQINSVYELLGRLRKIGFVTWESNTAGTISRPKGLLVLGEVG